MRKKVKIILIVVFALLLLLVAIAAIYILSMDKDGDGLSDWKEFSLGTDWNYANSDSDDLSDYDEVKIYNTNPLSGDTDNDGANDTVEIENNMDPSLKDTNGNGILDGEERVTQEISLAWGKEEALEKNGTIPIMKMTGRAAGGDEINIEDVSNNGLYDFPFKVGAAYEILYEENSFEEAELSFQLSESMLVGRDMEGLAIYFVASDESSFDILSVTHDAQNRVITALMGDEGVYFVVDMESLSEYYEGIIF